MKKKYNALTLITLFGICVLHSQHSFAQKLENTFRDWSVYTGSKDGFKLCYMVSYPKSKTGNYSNRSEPYVMVTNIGGQAIEISATGGYPYKSGTEPRMIIDGEEHRLSMIRDETAWFKTDEYDATAIEKMKKGYKLVLRGTSKIGTYSIDTYSLSGFTDAYNKITGLCN
ncbi:MAG: invasion associated locus B family protein [Rickettsiales bacterium]|nr:invasion associated locus B family protein [Pseudomonadota bacterium]MDA0966350.1 invasion associated locus B family protein [Pseudomonadota bacterium]MDG4543982.1 invasion associated locus B family protein [Rickettsiales bacterium]MDG4545476.1 invasion associated locus B family protein [Rickettsiales bacterium]MDG4547925.1 invasion associated locus B family protein [Rickettsiales bacterium]